ncbi:MAG: Gfo/Idh/MocA family oxidoreductase [Candidatus Hydrogenedentales bacterium]|jgi:predicted dehydrogenase
MNHHQRCNKEEGRFSRRDFVKMSAAAGAAFTLSRQAASYAQTDHVDPELKPMDRVRIAMVGVGGMGTNHLGNLLKLEGVDILAVCDIDEEKATHAQDMVEAAGQKRPTAYCRGERDFERLCAEEELDLVYTATPHKWHVPVCVAAMENGKHAATEVPAAPTLEGCWQLVDTAEATKKHCVMMENCCYGRTEMAVLNMVRQGVLGELLHAECGYLHDIRDIYLQTSPGRKWFQENPLTRNGNLYPTHGLGPVAQCMNINRGDQFSHLVSMSSPGLGLAQYAKEKLPADDPRQDLKFKSGDVNTVLIQTQLGRTITVLYNCNNPRPYTRINLVQGTRGIVQGYPDRVHIEGVSPDHEWEEMEAYYDRYDAKLWRDQGDTVTRYGHGGMDFLEDMRLIACLRAGLPTDQDVYDAAAWSAIGPLSERSVAGRAAVTDVPDFTRGRWRDRAPLEVPGEV